jgi:hypothetical protein
MVMVSKGVEAIILMGDAPLLGVLVKYPISWREGFGAVVMHIVQKVADLPRLFCNCVRSHESFQKTCVRGNV